MGDDLTGDPDEFASGTAAAAQLAAAERARQRGEQQVDYRVFGWVELGGAVAAAALFALVLLTTREQYEGGATGMLAVLPVLLASGLIRGLLEGFGLRPLLPARVQMFVVVALATPLVAFIAQIFFGTAYPWWLVVLAGAVIVGVLGGLGVSHLRRARNTVPSTSIRVPETTVVRVSTAALGVTIGMALVLVPLLQWPYLSLVFILIVGAWTFPSPFGLMRVGASWGRRHWIGFAGAMVVLYVMMIVDAVQPGLVTALALPAGILAAAPLVLSAFWPARGSHV